jgi:hypothetical protein
VHPLQAPSWLTSPFLPAIFGLAGILVGVPLTAWLSSRRDTAQRRYSFRERQLRDLYSPLLALRSEIRIKSELREKVRAAAHAEWVRLCQEARDTANPPENLRKLSTEKGPEMERLFDYDKQQLVEDLVPSYGKMLTVLRDNLWLAEPETRSHLGKLIEFVELWERWLAKAVTAEVVSRLGHNEESLHPFYSHLERKHDELRGRLSRGTSG